MMQEEEPRVSTSASKPNQLHSVRGLQIEP